MILGNLLRNDLECCRVLSGHPNRYLGADRFNKTLCIALLIGKGEL